MIFFEFFKDFFSILQDFFTIWVYTYIHKGKALPALNQGGRDFMMEFDENKSIDNMNTSEDSVEKNKEGEHAENKYDRSSEGMSYSYTNYRPAQSAETNYYYSGPSVNYEKKKNSKGKKTAALAILIVVCMVMSSIGTAFMMTYLNRRDPSDPGKAPGESTQPPSGSENIHGGVDGPVTITKNPSEKVDLVEGEVGKKGMSVAQVSSLVADSVVEVTTSSVQYDFFYGQQVVSGAGSGVIFGRSETNSKEYYIVTNHHVIEGAKNISVSLRDGSEYECELIGSDIISDIGILRIESEKELVVASLGDSDSLVVGEDVVAIGNPLGRLGGTVTNGIISALERKVNVQGLEMTLLQHNAAISPGNSGGGLFDTAGYLVGIVNAKSNDSSAEGLGFAIPINYAYNIIYDILNNGYVTGRAALPFSVQEYTSSSLFGGTSVYVVVTSEPEEYDIRFNDIVYSINDRRISGLNGLISILSDYEVGETVTLQVARTVGREVKLFEYEVTLVESVSSSVDS